MCIRDRTERMLGALCVSVPMLGITVLAPGSFGGGDVKFMCAAGALLGWRHILWSAAAGIFSAGVYVPVSYTHLDVYKRQL